MAASVSRRSRSRVSARAAFLTAWLLCAVLDISAAFIQAWMQAGRLPAAVLKGIASALWGRAAVTGGAEMAAIGLAMHVTVAFSFTLVFHLLSRRFLSLRTAPLLVVGPFYGVFAFSVMNFGTLPFLSWVRSLYLGTPAVWPGTMGWPLLGVHMVCVGLPIAWGIRRHRLSPFVTGRLL